MAKTGTKVKQELQELHELITGYFIRILKDELNGEGEPLPSSTMNVIVTFLKNNDITADVKDDVDLEEMRESIMKDVKGKNIVKNADRISKYMDDVDPSLWN